MGLFDSDYDNGKEQGAKDRENIEKNGYGIIDALDDVIRDVTPSTPSGNWEKGYDTGRSGDNKK